MQLHAGQSNIRARCGRFELDVRDELSHSQARIRTQAVVNATGAQADELSGTQKKCVLAAAVIFID